MRTILIVSLCINSLYLLPAKAADPLTHCYPFNIRNVQSNEAKVSSHQERWCYQKLGTAGKELYVFNGDRSTVRPELALLKKEKGVLVHGSLAAGEVTMHSISLQAQKFNPFPVPLEEPQGLAAVQTPASFELLASAKDVLLQLRDARDEGTLEVTAGLTAAEAAYQPWRGFWWPYKAYTMNGPLAKYDAFSNARDVAGTSVSWERGHHISHGLWWEGHCNGWAAAAIIRRQPREAIEDSTSGVTFSVSDQKGILTEADFCVPATFFGNRYDGGRGESLSDVEPAVFHTALTYNIGKLHKPIAMDYRRDAVVDNHVVSAYSMDIEETSPDLYTVTANLKVHRYDAKISDEPGIATPYKLVYKYTLRKKSDGSVVSGRWLSTNPDFLWVPLSQGPCAKGNTGLDADMIHNIFH